MIIFKGYHVEIAVYQDIRRKYNTMSLNNLDAL